MRGLVIDTIAPEGIAYPREHGFHVDQVESTLAPNRLQERIADYEASITCSSMAVTVEFIARARRLPILGRAGVGVDNIGIDACFRKGVVNVNIASMHVGPRTKRGGAIVVLLLDEDVPPEVMEVGKAVEADFARLIRIEP